jgi:hypothetical protein
MPTMRQLRLPNYADAVFSEPGRCWRMVQKPGVGAPDHCSELVVKDQVPPPGVQVSGAS